MKRLLPLGEPALLGVQGREGRGPSAACLQADGEDVFTRARSGWEKATVDQEATICWKNLLPSYSPHCSTKVTFQGEVCDQAALDHVAAPWLSLLLLVVL